MRRYRKASGALLAAISLTTLSSPLMTHAAQVSTTAAAPWTVYTISMHNSTAGDLVSINGKTGAIQSSIPFVAATPKSLFISPDGSHAYLLGNASYITVLHLTGDTPQSVIQLSGAPKAMALAPDGKAAYVTVGQYVYSVDLSSNRLQELASFVSPPYGVAVSPDGKTLYVATASTADNHASTIQLVPIDIVSKTSSTPINLGMTIGLPMSVNLSTGGSTAYVNVNGSPLDIVHLKTGVVKKALMGGQSPGGPFENIAIDPNGRFVFGENSWWNSVSYFNLKTGQTGDLMDNGPLEENVTKGLAIAPDGSRIYVTYYDGMDLNPTFNGGIQVLSPSVSGTNKRYVLETIPQGPDMVKPHGLTGIVAVAPDQAPHASFTIRMAPVGHATVFNASSSYGDSTIKTYHWDFGDGSTSVSSTPVVRHAYRKAGKYTVTLTETDKVGATVNNPSVFDGQRVEVNAGSSTAETSHPIEITNEMMSAAFWDTSGHPHFAHPTVISSKANLSWLDLYALVGHPFHARFSVIGGVAPYHWRVVSGSLPPGLILNSKTGLLSGIPKQSEANSFFTISAADVHGGVASSRINLWITDKSEAAISIDGNLYNSPVVVQKDPVHKDQTTYISLGFLGMPLKTLGIQASWKGKDLSLITPNTLSATGTNMESKYPYSIWINGLKVGTFPKVAKPKQFGADTFIPLYYLMAALNHIQGLKQSWDGTTWSITTS